MDLDIWLGPDKIASTVRKSRGTKVVVVYDDGAVGDYRGGTPLLSCSLPTPGTGEPAKSRAWLEGLLPEGRALETAAARLAGVRLDNDGAPATPADVVALLAEYGRECAGAVITLPAGETPAAHAYADPQTSEQLAELISALPRRPLGADPERDIRMSLGGAQDKLLLARVNGKWCEPVGGYPSTHIIKPTTVWPHSAENEAMVLALGRHNRLTSCEAWVEKMGQASVLVAQRYDRRIEADGTITRLHQEDMCQAAGLRPKDKYLIGRPSERMTKTLREFADSPAREIAALFRQVTFRAVVGDEDGHGKNYSILLDDGNVRLAPLYDSLCTLHYPELSGRMGAKIGPQVTLAKVNRAALLEEAQVMGIPATEARDHLDELAAELRAAIDNLDAAYTEGWPSEPVIATIVDRIAKLESGEPFGDSGTGSTRTRAGTMDRATGARSSNPQSRQPAGITTGGQFAPSRRGRSDLRLGGDG